MKILNETPPDIFSDVEKFLLLAQPDVISPIHQIPSKQVLELAFKLIDEEVNKEKYAVLKTLQMLHEGKYSIELMAELLDSIVDSIYVLAWTAKALQFPFNAAWNEVQEANMAKFPEHLDCLGQGCNYESTSDMPNVGVTHSKCVDGQLVIRNTYGKIAKPEGWKAPDIWGVIYEAWSREVMKKDKTILPEPNRREIK